MGQMTAAGNPCAMNTSDGATNPAYRGTDGLIYLFDLEPGATTWHILNVSTISGAPAAIHDPSCAVRGFDGLNEFQYIAAAGPRVPLKPPGRLAASLQIPAAWIGRGSKTAAYNRTDGVFQNEYFRPSWTCRMLVDVPVTTPKFW